MSNSTTIQLSHERIHLHNPFIGVGLSVTIDGSYLLDELVDAIDRVARQADAFKYRILEDSTGMAYYVRRTDSDLNGFEVHINDVSSSTETSLYEEMCRAFNPDNSALVRFCISPTNAGFRVLVYAHHVIADGRSLVMLIREVLRCLDDRTASVDTIPMKSLNTDALFPSVQLPPTLSSTLEFARTRWDASSDRMTSMDHAEIAATFLRDHGIALKVFRTDSLGLKTLLERCRAEKVSINSAIIAAIMLTDDSIDSIHVPVSLQEDNEMYTGNIVSTATLSNSHQRATLWGQAKTIQKEMSAIKADPGRLYSLIKFLTLLPPSLYDAVLQGYFTGKHDSITAIIGRLLGYGGTTSGVVVSNLGKVVESKYKRFLVSDSVFFPPFNGNLKYSLGVASCADSLSISLVCMRKCVVKNSEFVRQLLYLLVEGQSLEE